jgi:hypothetical protein
MSAEDSSCLIILCNLSIALTLCWFGLPALTHSYFFVALHITVKIKCDFCAVKYYINRFLVNFYSLLSLVIWGLVF